MPDPVAMAIALDPGIVLASEMRHVAIANDGLCRGQTVVDHLQITGNALNVEIVTEVSRDGFLEMLYESVGGARRVEELKSGRKGRWPQKSAKNAKGVPACREKEGSERNLSQHNRNEERRREPQMHADGRECRRLLLLPLETSSRTLSVPRRFQWYIAEGMFSLPATKYSMVIRFSVVR